MIIRFRRLLSLPLNLGRLRLCRPARDHLRRGRVSSVSRRRIRVRLHSRLFLALLRARALSPRLSRAHRAPGFPFSPPRVIRRPSQLIIRNRREYRILRVPRVPIETSRIRQSPRSRVRARRRVPPPRTTPPPPHTRARRSSRAVVVPSHPSRTHQSRRFPVDVRPLRANDRDRRPAIGRGRLLHRVLARASPSRRASLDVDATSGRPPPRAPPRAPPEHRSIDRSVAARPTPSSAVARSVVRCVYFSTDGRGGVYTTMTRGHQSSVKKMDGRSDVAGPCRHPRGRVPSSIRTVRVGGWDSRPLDAGGGD